MFFHVNTRNGCVVLTCSSVKHSFNHNDGSAVEHDICANAFAEIDSSYEQSFPRGGLF